MSPMSQKKENQSCNFWVWRGKLKDLTQWPASSSLISSRKLANSSCHKCINLPWWSMKGPADPFFQSPHPSITENSLQASPDPTRTRISLQWLLVAAHWHWKFVYVTQYTRSRPQTFESFAPFASLFFFKSWNSSVSLPCDSAPGEANPDSCKQFSDWINRFCLKNYLTWMQNLKRTTALLDM